MHDKNLRTPRTLDEACFCPPPHYREVRDERIKARIEAGVDVLFAVLIGLAGAVVLFYWLSS